MAVGASKSTASQNNLSPREHQLMEEVLTKENMTTAMKRVEANKGAAGIDGMTVGELNGYLKQEWPRIRGELLGGRYKPKPVRRVMIPKTGGGERALGIPTVVDRLIQQAVHQVISPSLRRTFQNRVMAIGQSAAHSRRWKQPAVCERRTALGGRHRLGEVL